MTCLYKTPRSTYKSCIGLNNLLGVVYYVKGPDPRALLEGDYWDLITIEKNRIFVLQYAYPPSLDLCAY